MRSGSVATCYDTILSHSNTPIVIAELVQIPEGEYIFDGYEMKYLPCCITENHDELHRTIQMPGML